MYERNAIIIERYFNKMFGYNIKNNIKTNFYNYCELIKASEKYKNSTEEEEEVIIEYDIIANKIRDIQKKQDDLNEKNLQLQSERNDIFQNLDEDANLIQKNLDIINNNIKKVDDEIQENALNFANIVAEFNEKSIVRNKCGKNRRTVEIDYNKKLNETLDNYKNIDINLEKRAKQFIELDTTEIKDELKKEIQKNGENEKIPFFEDVIEQAIILSIDIQKRETEILSNIYEKTNKLFSEIKNNSLKIEKHKKYIIDSNSKMTFISAIKEYVIQFLDNERLAAVNGENEYKKLMKEACKYLKKDLAQITNLYTLLLKEISKKATKKSYNDLYNIEYLQELENNAEQFENEVKKIKLPVAVINPNYWRIDGMKKIYDVFNKCVTENYNRDLKEFNFSEGDSNEDDSDGDEKGQVNITENNEEKFKNSANNKNEGNIEEKVLDEKIDSQKNDNLDNQSDEKLKSEIDKKIDIILGLSDNENKLKGKDKNSTKNNKLENDEIEDEDLWNDEDIEDDDEMEDEDNDVWDDELDEDNEWQEEVDDDDEWQEETEEDDDIEDETEDDKEWDEDNDEEWDEITEEDDDTEDETEEDEDWDEEQNDDDIDYEGKSINEDEDYDEEVDYDIWGNNITNKRNKPKGKKQNNEVSKNDDWENEFINIDKKDKNKKKGFFEKFKK